ncbi:MAG TPA: iron-sulfur cluster assembly accessory protein [Anaerolineae bacterium]|nr:iron-sulfur cluster assembly accessory protein [Anaerolineae bacterium]HXW00043.1 iron-sulfur cluster assembly accessory protein [Anaerolineae bacterium]
MITLTSAAAEKLQGIMAEKGITDHALRVFVSGGGCSGLSYGMTFAEGPEFGDQEFHMNGVKVVVDMGSIQYVDGAEIDYIDSLMGGGFRIENPNAVQSCACGSSFRTSAGEQGTPCSH